RSVIRASRPASVFLPAYRTVAAVQQFTIKRPRQACGIYSIARQSSNICPLLAHSRHCALTPPASRLPVSRQLQAVRSRVGDGCFCIARIPETGGQSLRLPLAIGAYAPIKVREKCICAYFKNARKAERSHVCALIRRGRRAARTQLLDRGDLRGPDPHDWDRCAPKFRNLPETNCSRPQGWA